jgi:hypothetical protein
MRFSEREREFTLQILRYNRETILTDIEPPTLRIGCCKCDTHRSILYWGIGKVQEQIRMWHDGWRRDPETGLDYCPGCRG